MTLAIKTTNRAEQDIAEAAEFISRDSIESTIRFVDAVDLTSRQLAESPLVGEAHSHPRHADLRVCLLSGFRNYAVFYQVANDRLTIVRVLRGSRDHTAALNE